MIEFRKPWRVCPSCNQFYQNELAIDIASKFVSFVRRQYPRDQRQVESLHTKLNALDSMFERLQRNCKCAAISDWSYESSRTFDKALFRNWSIHIQHSWLYCYRWGIGRECKEGGCPLCKSTGVNDAIGDAEGIATAKGNIAVARSQ
jgi:hypothetical protein